MTLRAAFVAAVVAVAMVFGSPLAHAGKDDLEGIRVVFARDQSLWMTDARGKGPAVELAQLSVPATEVRDLRVDPHARVLVAHIGDTWSWLPLDGSTKELTKLACADANLVVVPDGTCVVCATAQ